MLRIKLFFCSESAAIDMRLNTLSAFHIAEELNAPVFPVAIPKLTAIIIFTREQGDPDDPTVQMTISLGGRSLFQNPLVVNFSQRLSTRAVVDINGLVLLAPGTLRFSVRDGERELGTWDIVINQIGQPGMHQLFLPQQPPAERARD